MNKFTAIFILLVFTLTAGCDEGFPSESKPEIPPDHTIKLRMTFHKEGYSSPFGYNAVDGTMNCASSRCHQNDLRGGMAQFVVGDSVYYAVSPSCWQCHGKLWSDIDSVINK